MRISYCFIWVLLLLFQTACITLKPKLKKCSDGGYQVESWTPGVELPIPGTTITYSNIPPVPKAIAPVMTDEVPKSDGGAVERTSSEDKQAMSEKMRKAITPPFVEKTDEKQKPNPLQPPNILPGPLPAQTPVSSEDQKAE